MFDFANSGYTTVVITAVFNAYFVAHIAGNADLKATYPEAPLIIGVGDAPLLESLGSRFETTDALEDYLKANGIETTFWSRVGE